MTGANKGLYWYSKLFRISGDDYGYRWDALEKLESQFFKTCGTCKHNTPDEVWSNKPRTFWEFISRKKPVPSVQAMWFSTCSKEHPDIKAEGTLFAYFKYNMGCHGHFWEKKDGEEERDKDSEY